ncbi:MAG: DUF481 domain-containing protein [Desulfurobacteriaceae bacterium]
MRLKTYLLSLFFLLIPFVAFGEDIQEENNTEEYKNQIEISYSDSSGNTNTETLAVKYKLRKEWKKARFYSDGSYLLKFDEDEKTTEQLDIDSRFEFDLSERSLFFLKNFIKRDIFAGYDLRIGLGPGIGYQVIKEEKQSLKVFIGIDYTYNDYTENGEETYTALDISTEYQRQFVRDLTFIQKASYLVSLRDSKDYFVNSETKLEIPITKRTMLGISYKIEYRNILPDEAEYHTDKLFLVSWIYRF